MSPLYQIWSTELNEWLGKDGGAGKYARNQAISICAVANQGIPALIPVPLADIAEVADLAKRAGR